jgi:REP element-mobilizing transposase RayT
MQRKSRRTGQLSLPFNTWGGARKGAGRKPASGRANTPHRARPEHKAAHPLHVTLRAGLRPLRSQHVFPTIRRALSCAARASPAFRIAHFSVQGDHLHLLVEASDKAALSSGMRGLVIRVARQVNRLLMRRGPLWADRWHARALTSPRQVRNALVYVLGNFRKHGQRSAAPGADPFSSARYFDGWRLESGTALPLAGPAPLGAFSGDPNESGVVAARTWLARKGWRRHGLIGLEECPR